ncbi:MAG: sodium/glutamate symporter [Gammaproteobacteria bacterium]|nr:sodium/glutamate symporter [Gammaproteobacteria bacterium]
MSEISVLEILPMDMLSMSIVVLFVGMFLNKKIRILGDNYIPPAVTGGLLFATVTALVYSFADLQVEFDMRMRDLLLLVFFSTVGLSARLSALASGGKALLLLVLVAGVFLVLQNTVGIAIAVAADAHPGFGLMAGSVAFAGGHGTAIAWGQVAEDAGLEGAAAIGLAFATFGLVAGGIVGGPIARRLIERHSITGPATKDADQAAAESATEDAADDQGWLYHVLISVLMLTLCVSGGDIVNRMLGEEGLRLPGFLTAMFVGIMITNIADVLKRPLNPAVVEKFGDVALNVFLAMSMMAIQLWTLSGAFQIIGIVLILQILLMTMFAIWVVFRVMGSDYDAVVIAAGFAGLGLGATPVAIANMNAVTSHYGPSTKAFLVVPLVGAFFIDILNAGTINFFIQLIQDYLL